jgi:hypothetical protein
MWSGASLGFPVWVGTVLLCPNRRSGPVHPAGPRMQLRSRRPRTGFRFGFDGPSDGRAEYQQATVDEILESLGRHSQLSDQLGPRDGFESDESAERLIGDMGQARPSDSGPIGRGSLGRYGFGIMLIGGMLILSVYGILKAITITPTSTNAIASVLGLVLNDPVKLGLLGLLCLVPVVMALKRRNRVGRSSLQ